MRVGVGVRACDSENLYMTHALRKLPKPQSTSKSASVPMPLVGGRHSEEVLHAAEQALKNAGAVRFLGLLDIGRAPCVLIVAAVLGIVVGGSKNAVPEAPAGAVAQWVVRVPPALVRIAQWDRIGLDPALRLWVERSVARRPVRGVCVWVV